jgi:hypothetical protein
VIHAEVFRMNRSPLVALVAFALAACTPAPQPQKEPDPLDGLPMSDSTAKATAAPPPVEPAPTAAPTATATATATAAAAPSTPTPSGRPWSSFTNAEKIASTFGSSPPAKLELGKEGAVLRIPEFALRDPVNLTFELVKKLDAGRKAKGGQGASYHLLGQRPPAEEAATVTTESPLELRLPLGKLTTANLAIGEAMKDDKGRPGIKWTVIAPKKTEGGLAYFDLSTFTDATLQLTSDPPSAPAAK